MKVTLTKTQLPCWQIFVLQNVHKYLAYQQMLKTGAKTFLQISAFSLLLMYIHGMCVHSCSNWQHFFYDSFIYCTVQQKVNDIEIDVAHQKTAKSLKYLVDNRIISLFVSSTLDSEEPNRFCQIGSIIVIHILALAVLPDLLSST